VARQQKIVNRAGSISHLFQLEHQQPSTRGRPALCTCVLYYHAVADALSRPSIQQRFSPLITRPPRRLSQALPGLFSTLLACLTFSGCEYECPITTAPTRPVEQKLIGNWQSADGKDLLRIRAFDESNYAVTYNGDLYRAHHSDFAQTAFVSVRYLGPDNRKFALATWSLTKSDQSLQLRVVSSKIVAKEMPNAPALQKELLKKISDPALFGFTQDYRRTE
jgi:hypothetical protein